MKNNESISFGKQVAPVLVAFFVMAFSDLVAPITPRIAREFPEQMQSWVTFIPSMVFIWFFALSLPFATLMNRTGRRRMAIISCFAISLGMMIAYFAKGNIWLYMVGFAIMGIGCTANQVSVNPMLALLPSPEKCSSYLTLGQVFRNSALLLMAPLVIVTTQLTGSWQAILPIYAGVSLICALWMWLTRFEERVDSTAKVNFRESLKGYKELLTKRDTALAVGSIGVFIIFDVATGYISSQLPFNSDGTIGVTSFAYLCRIGGAIFGVWALRRFNDLRFLTWNLVIVMLGTVLLFAANSLMMAYAATGIIGFGAATIFAIFYSTATKLAKERTNEVAGLMIMTISTGAIATPITAIVIGAMGGVKYGVWVMVPCIIYMWAVAQHMRRLQLNGKI